MIDEIRTRPIRPSDMPACVALLADAGLPTVDVSVERLALVAELGEQVVGLIGLQQFESLGLLRSLVVDSHTRARGLGKRLVVELEALARERGIAELWLLTIDADPYFERLGYIMQERSAAPEAITATEEVSSLCPGDAALMKKPL